MKAGLVCVIAAVLLQGYTVHGQGNRDLCLLINFVVVYIIYSDIHT